MAFKLIILACRDVNWKCIEIGVTNGAIHRNEGYAKGFLHDVIRRGVDRDELLCTANIDHRVFDNSDIFGDKWYFLLLRDVLLHGKRTFAAGCPNVG